MQCSGWRNSGWVTARRLSVEVPVLEGSDWAEQFQLEMTVKQAGLGSFHLQQLLSNTKNGLKGGED